MGCDVLEVAPSKAGEAVEVEWEDGSRTNATFWADIAAEGNGRVLARIVDGPWAGRPAVIETSSARERLLPGRSARHAPAWRGSTPAFPRYPPGSLVAPTARARKPGVERVVRPSRTVSGYEFLINHSDEDRHVEIAPEGFEMLSERDLEDKVTLPPMGVAIVRHAESAPLSED